MYLQFYLRITVVFFLLGPMVSAAKTIVINIEGSGESARFVAKGANGPGLVTVRKGDTVRWVNQDSQTPHTATSHKKGGDGKPLFDSLTINSDAFSEIVFDESRFKDFGVEDGEHKTIDYECIFHGGMQGKLVLSDSDAPVLQPSNTVNVSAETVNGNHRFNPNPAAPIKVGSLIVWKVASGQHAVRFTNWDRAKQYIEVIDDGPGFNNATGEGTSMGASDDPLLIIRITAIPEDKIPIRYDCPLHQGVMLGQVCFENCVFKTSPEKYTNPNPKYEAPTGLIASFDRLQVGRRTEDSYYAYAADMNADGLPDLIVSGLGVPERQKTKILWYENPTWEEHEIASLEVPVALAAGDIDGDKLNDLAVCYEYGQCILNCKPENGTLAWLKNPGADTTEPWKLHEIGAHLASHRLSLGHFSKTSRLQLLSVPVVGGVAGDIHAPIETRIYDVPKDPAQSKSWDYEVVSDSLRVIHDIEVGDFTAGESSNLKSFLTASEEGVTLLAADADSGNWAATSIGKGERGQLHTSPKHWAGSGSVSVGRYDEDPFAYVASTEPFHGNIFAVYTKDSTKSMRHIKWKRHVVDRLGPLTNGGEGGGHDVQVIDVDGDGRDECLVAMRGPKPYSGVMIYRPIDLANGKFERQHITSTSAAIVVTSDFDQDGRMDFATVPYRVYTYFVAEDQDIMIYLNRTPQRKSKGK